MSSWFGDLTQANSYMFGQGKVASLATPSINISAREKAMSRKEEETKNLIVIKLQEDKLENG